MREGFGPRAAALVLMACIPALPGCFTAAAQAYQSIKGADGRVWMHQPIRTPMDRFTRLRIENFGTEMDSGVPPLILQQVEGEIKKYLLEEEAFKQVELSEDGGELGDPNLLVIRGVIIDYDPGKAAGRWLGVSGERYLTARIHFVDGGSGDVLGVGHIAGVVKGEIGRDMTDTMTGLAKGIADLIDEGRKFKKDEKKDEDKG